MSLRHRSSPAGIRPRCGRAQRRLSVERLELRLAMAADFGDAPAPYPTTMAEGGASHEAVGPMLGTSRDTEANGVHSAAADADGADDNGVVFGALRVGTLGAEAVVTVQGAAPSAYLNAWIDFNRDGAWSGPGEQVAINRVVANGQTTIKFDIPATAAPGVTFARFRLTTAPGFNFKGAAQNGEVEDFAVTLAPPSGASGTYLPRQAVESGADGATGLFAADVDSDGDMDLVSAAYAEDTVAWHENTGGGNFVTRVVSTTADGAISVLAIDFDRDGDIDLLSASELDAKIVWYENNGSEAFTARTIATAATGVKTIFAADIDADGDWDVAAAEGTRMAWYQNGGAQSSFTQRLLPTATESPYGISVVDLDRDGDLDILYASAGSGEVGWYENNGAQTFTNRPVATNAGTFRSVTAADMDGDGDLDILAASVGATPVLLYKNVANAFTTSQTLPSGLTGAWSLTAADMDGDGDLDVVAASSNEDRVMLLVNNGSGGFTSRVISTLADGPRGVIAADIDGDGRLDVATASTGDDTIGWYRAQTGGDFDRDGDADGNDFLLWQRTLGQTATVPGGGADADFSGTVGGPDLAPWRNGFGGAASAGAAALAESGTDEPVAVSAFAADESELLSAVNRLPMAGLMGRATGERRLASARPASVPGMAAIVVARDSALAALGASGASLRRAARGASEAGEAAVEDLLAVELAAALVE